MIELPRYQGAVYILENTELKQVKVGVTGNHITYVYGRLSDVNGKWLEQKVTCQVCGGRRLKNSKGHISKHVVSGIKCPGSDAPPLEDDVKLAKSYLEKLKGQQKTLTGSEKGSATRIINNLERRIVLYKQHKRPVGIWQFHAAYNKHRQPLIEERKTSSICQAMHKSRLILVQKFRIDVFDRVFATGFARYSCL